MRRRHLFAGIAFALGLLLGILLFAGLALDPADADRPATAEPDEPRIVAGVSMDVHNLGRLERDVRVELRDGEGDLRFADAATLGPDESLRRSMVNLLAGSYRLHLIVDGAEAGTEPFQAGSCASGTRITFSVSDGPQGAPAVRSMVACR